MSAATLLSADAAGRPPAAGVAAARVMGLVDWRFRRDMVDHDAPIAERIDQLGELIGRQLRELATVDPELAGDYALCSSYLPKVLVDVPDRAERLTRRVAAIGGRAPSGLVQTYECAGWGCIWRFHADHGRGDDLIITVVDACLHGFTHNVEHSSIGVSGFGMTSVHLRLPAQGRRETVLVDGPYPDSGFKEFIRALRSRQARAGSVRTMVPFFRAELGAIATRIVGAERATRNRNDEHGHCFGSDPWIALAEEVLDGTVSPGDPVTLGTLAYNGYFAVADVLAPEPRRIRCRTWA